MYSFPDLEPVWCSMSAFKCCFLTCIQISQEPRKVVWYSHFLKNFPQFVVIHTVKCFGILNKAEVDVLLELFCFFDVPTDVGNLISGSFDFLKSFLTIWKITVYVLLKPGLENFAYYFASVWDECNYTLVWTFFGIAFFGLEWKLIFSSPVATGEFAVCSAVAKLSKLYIHLLAGFRLYFEDRTNRIWHIILGIWVKRGSQDWLQCFNLSIWKYKIDKDETGNGVSLRAKNRKYGPVLFKDFVWNLSWKIEWATR